MVMEQYTLTSKDYEWLKNIMKNNESIDAIYKKLCELEINGQKDSDEYKKYIDYLKIALEVENNIYATGKINFYNGSALVNYIIGERMPDDFLNDRESIIAKDYNNRVIRRVLKNLIGIVASDYETVKKYMIPTQLVEFMKYIGMEDADQSVSNALYSSVQMKDALDQDISNGFLTILRELTNSSKYAEYKNELIASKYHIAFIEPNTETLLLNNSFELPDGFYPNTSFAATVTETPEELLEQIKNTQGIQEATHHMMGLIRMHDGDFEDRDKAFSSILRQSFMRSAFMLVSEDVLGEYNYHFHDFIESDTYLKDYPNDNVGVQMVVDGFKLIDTDKKKLTGGTQFGSI